MTECKFSLVGWGSDQVILHFNDSFTGLSVWKKSKLKLFGAAPWLTGCVAVAKVAPQPPTADGYCPEAAQFMRAEAVAMACSAIKHEDIYLLSEAVVTTYAAQQLLGKSALPCYGELGKRYSGNGSYGLYIFQDSKHREEFFGSCSVLKMT